MGDINFPAMVGKVPAGLPILAYETKCAKIFLRARIVAVLRVRFSIRHDEDGVG